MTSTHTGSGTPEDPWNLTTPPGEVGLPDVPRRGGRPADALHEMLKAHGDWMSLGNADEQKPAVEGTVEAWAR